MPVYLLSETSPPVLYDEHRKGLTGASERGRPVLGPSRRLFYSIGGGTN